MNEKETRKRECLIGFLTIIFFLASFSSSSGAEISVPNDFGTIQAGIDAASPGDTVIIADGTYKGNGNIDLDFKGKSITVKSENGPENCIIDCEGNGRGFYFHTGETQSSILSGITITNGHASNGGGIRCSSSPIINNCRIIGNTATSSGGGIFFALWSAKVTNCILAGNTAGAGSAVYVSNAKPEIINCTMIGNTATVGAIGISTSDVTVVPTIVNSILWDEPSIFYYASFPYTPNISHCNINSTEVESSSIIHEDPKFVDVSGTFPLEWDLHIQSSSPCIDKGKNGVSNIPTTDFDGNLRIIDGDGDGTATVDIGADEYQSDSQVTVTGTLTLPDQAIGSQYVVLVDTDIDGDNGYVRATTGICGSSKTIAYEVQDVPKGTYYIYAVVRIVSAIDSPPEYGDYIGFYGTGSMPPAAPNASITGKEAESFEITLTVFSEEIDGDLAYMIEDFDGEFIGTTDYGNIPLGWSVSGPQVVNFMQGMDSHHGQFCLHANASTNQTEYTYLKAELEGQPGTLTDLQIQAKADTSGKAEARFLIEDAVIPMSTTLFWYDYSSTDWRTVTFEDVEISASGKLSFYIDIAHTDDNGSSNFYIDCFTSDTPLTLLLPDASDDDNVKDDNGGNGNTSCYIYTVKY